MLLKTKKVTAAETAKIFNTVEIEPEKKEEKQPEIDVADEEDREKYQYEEEEALVSTYATDRDRVSDSKFSRDTENYSEIEMFINMMMHFYTTFESKFKPENSPDLTTFIRKYPHPRFLNAALCYIVTNYFKDGNTYVYKEEYVTKYNKEVEENIYKRNVLQLINTSKNTDKSFIQPHDIFRYIILFNKYK